MKNILFTFLILISPSAFAQVNVTQDVLPNTNSSDSTAVLNNQLRLQQNAINAVGGYFNANQYLTEANGGTGVNLSTVPNGSILVQNSSTVGIGTFNPGTSGQFLQSQGAGVVPIFATLPHALQLFTSSGTFTAPTGVTTVFLTGCSAGAGGGSDHATGGGAGGGGGGECLVNFPYTVVPVSGYIVTIGAAGAGASGSASSLDGQSGGNTAFDTITLTGGSGGKAAGTLNGGSGGGNSFNSTTTTVSSSVPGNPTLQGGNGSKAGGGKSGAGGSTLFGQGASGVIGGNNGSNATGYASGGSGGASGGATNQNGGNGSQGFMLVEW